MFFAANITAPVNIINDVKAARFETFEELDRFLTDLTDDTMMSVTADVMEEWFDNEGEGHTTLMVWGVEWAPLPEPWEEWED